MIHEDFLLLCRVILFSASYYEGVVVRGHDVTVQFLGGSSVQSYLCKLGDYNFHLCEQHQQYNSNYVTFTSNIFVSNINVKHYSEVDCKFML